MRIQLAARLLVSVAALAAGIAQVHGDTYVTLSEDGSFSVTGTLGNYFGHGTLVSDPGLGGLPSLTFTLPSGISVLGGDVAMWEPQYYPTQYLSDLVRFEGGNTIRFYSDLGTDSIADTGFPVVYTPDPISSGWEIGPEGSNHYRFVAHPGGPGFTSADTVHYTVISDVPEPVSSTLAGLAILGYLGRRRTIRRI